MRHRKAGKKLNRTPAHRKALFKNLATALLKHERIETTVIKAKELRRTAEKIITIAKRGKADAHRRVFRIIKDKEIVKKLFNNLAGRFAERSGGYTRVIRIGNRVGDCAGMAIIELLDREPEPEKEKEKKSRKRKKAENKK